MVCVLLSSSNGEVKGSKTLTLNSADDKKMTTSRLRLLLKWMSERYVSYLYDLSFPSRAGGGNEKIRAWC